ncbi:MAG TPA: hypothetical protein VNO55_19720 [Polyangia bacterium]|nr:hypothetical protein [Polyangia bacterium]
MSVSTRPPPPPRPAAIVPVPAGTPLTPAKEIPELPLVSAILFRATDGSTWRMRISPTGTLLIDPAP